MNRYDVIYKDFVLIPLAAYDEGSYAAILIVRQRNGVESASRVLGIFPSPCLARQFALKHGMAEIDRLFPTDGNGSSAF